MYYGGYFKARMTFSRNYPYAPPGSSSHACSEITSSSSCFGVPKTHHSTSLILSWFDLTIPSILTHSAPLPLEFRFLQPLYHPNIYKDGRLCISILHPPGEDEMSGELAAERWTPAQRVESVLISILSLLDDAECSSAANVDAGVMFRTDPNNFRSIVKAQVEASKANMPPDFVMPVPATVTTQEVDKEEPDFWADSDVDSDVFGGSDSDEDLDMDQFSGSEDEDEEDDDELQAMDDD